VTSRGRRSGYGLTLGVVGLTAGLVWLLVVLVTTDAARADNVASILGFAVTSVSAMVTLVSWQIRSRRTSATPPTPEQLGQAVETLSGLIDQQWRREVEARALADPEPMPVHWRLSDPILMDHRRLIASGPLNLSGRSDRIEALVAEFRRLRRRRLVILGGPGAGKTTLALQLLLALNHSRQPGDPVPVLLSLTSWSIETQPRPQDWLSRELERGYPTLGAFGVTTTAALVERGHILPVLDGLDEIPARRRPAIIAALNRSLVDDTGLILTSRAREYRDTVTAASTLTAAAVIEPLPLTAAQVASYLAHLLPLEPGAEWRQLLTALRHGTAINVASTLATPLGLWLIRAVYLDTGTDPTPLLETDRFATPAAIHTHLLEALIPAAIATRSPSAGGAEPFRPRRQYRAEQVQRWLAELAGQLKASGTSDWSWWRLGEHALTVRTFKLAIGIACGLTSGVIAGLTGSLADRATFGLAFGVTTGILVGIATGLIASPHNEPAHLDLNATALATRVVTGLIAGTTVGVLGGLGLGLIVGVAGLPGGISRGLAEGLRFGLTGGVAAGLAEGLAAWARTPGKAQRAPSPATSHRGDRALSILVAAGFALTVGPATGIAVGLGSTPAVGLAVGTTIGASAGLIGGMTGGLTARVTAGHTGRSTGTNTAWPSFLTATLWLAARRRLPLRLMTFLDDAHRLGLLRVVGSSYQFRHADLQHHLAAGHPLTAHHESSADRISSPPRSRKDTIG
jgi:NACHT domain